MPPPDGHVVAVTGASSGVGRATAQEFARGGATVGLIARGTRALAASAPEVEALGGDFDQQAKRRSLQREPTRHRRLLTGAGLEAPGLRGPGATRRGR